MCLGGELDTGFVLPGIFSDENPAPSASADALHWSFPDGTLTDLDPIRHSLSDAATSEKLARMSKANGITQGWQTWLLLCIITDTHKAPLTS